MSTWNDLASRCEAATGADRELDCAIHRALGWTEIVERLIPFTTRREWEGLPPNASGIDGPDWIGALTKSLDLITALIERELPQWQGDLDFGYLFEGTTYGARLFPPNGHGNVAGEAATPALALCAAFARAMSNKGCK